MHSRIVGSEPARDIAAPPRSPDEPSLRLPRHGAAIAPPIQDESGSRAFVADPVADSSDHVLIVGERARTARVRERLEGRPDTKRRTVACVVSLAEARQRLSNDFFNVVILIAPVRGVRFERALAELRDEPEGVPSRVHIALVSEAFEQPRARRLYERGADGVFAWPDDLGVLPDLISKTLAREARAPHPTTHPLESVVRDRLEARGGKMSRRVSVAIAAGRARLSGRVASLWAKLALLRRARESPGIDSVDAASLDVERSDRSDAMIGREIRALLDGVTSVDASTIGVTVHDGRVVLLGVVLQSEKRQVVELIAMVPGVLSVDDKSLSSAAKKSRARRIAERLQSSIRRKVNGHTLRVAVVGKTAILRGVGTDDAIRDAKRNLRASIDETDSVGKVLERAGPPLTCV